MHARRHAPAAEGEPLPRAVEGHGADAGVADRERVHDGAVCWCVGGCLLVGVFVYVSVFVCL